MAVIADTLIEIDLVGGTRGLQGAKGDKGDPGITPDMSNYIAYTDLPGAPVYHGDFATTLKDGTIKPAYGFNINSGGYTWASEYPKDDVDSLDDKTFIGKGTFVSYLEGYSFASETGSKIQLVFNSTDYTIQAILKDKYGNTIDSSDVVDLPIESVVVGGHYDSVNKKVVLELEGGSTIEFSVADLVAGLQSEITSSNKLASDLVDDTSSTNKFVTSAEKTTWNNKQNALTFDSLPTQDSTNPVSSGGLYVYFQQTIGDISDVIDAINGEVV